MLMFMLMAEYSGMDGRAQMFDPVLRIQGRLGADYERPTRLRCDEGGPSARELWDRRRGGYLLVLVPRIAANGCVPYCIVEFVVDDGREEEQSEIDEYCET